MRVTFRIPDDLHRQAKETAALQGRKLKDLVADGLERVLDALASKGGRSEAAKSTSGFADPADLVSIASAEKAPDVPNDH